jgi:uncharacterized protein (DUF305 family)
MRHLRWVTALLLAAAALGLAACGGDGGDEATGSTTATGAATGDEFDRAFIDAMVPHHESALDMARSAQAAELTQPDLQKVAEDILATQQAEIDQMKSWREEWFGSGEIDPSGAAALGMSDDEMGMSHDPDALLNAADVDAEFATMMIDHHEGAVAMAELALERAKHDEVKKLARRIIDAQEREIEVMTPHAAGEHGGHG